MEVTRQAGALGAVVTGVDIADLDDATFVAVHDALMEHLVLCLKDQGHATPDDQVAFTARWGRDRAAPVRAVDRGPPGDHRDLRPQPDHRHLALRLHLRQAAAVGQSAARPHHPAGRWRHHVLERVPRVRGALRRAARHASTRSRAVHYATQLAIDSGMPDDEIVNSHPVVCVHPETGRRALFVNDNYTKHFDGWSVADSQPLLDLPLRAVRQARAHVAAPLDRGRPPHLGQPLRAALGRRRHRRRPTLPAPHDHRRQTPSEDAFEEAAMTDIPWIVEPRRPRRRTPRHLDVAPAGEVPRRRPAHRDGARGHADPRRRHVPRGAGHRGPRRRLVVLRGPPVLGEAAHRRRGLSAGGDHVRRHHVRPDAPGLLAAAGPHRRHDDEPRRSVAVLPELPALLRADLPARQRQGAREALRRGVQRLAGRRVVRRERRPAHPAVPRPALGRRARRRRGPPQRGARRACGRVLRAAVVARAPEHPLRATGIRSSPACAETGTVVAMHIGSGTKTITTSADAPDAVQATNIFTNSAVSLVDFLFSGVLVRYPELKLLYAEAQIGWIPYVLERVDDVWETHRGWSHSQDARRPSRRRRTTTARSRSCFFKDSVGVEILDRVGADNIAFETDYPHQDGTWPNTHQVAKELFGHLDDDDGPQDRARQRHPPPRPRRPGRRHRSPLRSARHPMTVGEDALRRHLELLLGGLGVPAAQAATIADNLVEADLRGVDSHGSHLMALYTGRVRSGHLRPDTVVTTVADRGSTVLLDGGIGFGQVAGVAAIDLAVERGARARHGDGGGPRDHPRRRARLLHDAGVGRGVLRDGVPERRARSSRPSAAPPACSRPTRSRTRCRPDATPTSCYDVATTAAAGNKILLARKRGDAAIPEGWANDEHGHPTTDPQAASISQLQWFGGHKGFGIGAARRDHGRRARRQQLRHHRAQRVGVDRLGPPRQGCAASWCSTSPASCPLDAFRAHVDALIDDVHASELAPGAERVLVPGELEAERRAERLARRHPARRRARRRARRHRRIPRLSASLTQEHR